MRPGADLLRPYLNEAAERLLWRRRKGAFTVVQAKRALLEVLKEQQLPSLSARADLKRVVTDYFDGHPEFERVPGDEQAWEPKIKVRT